MSYNRPQKLPLTPDQEQPRHQKKGGVKKPFVIEWRYVGTSVWLLKNFGDWRIWNRYKTEKDRSKAFESIKRNRKHPEWEYQIP